MKQVIKGYKVGRNFKYYDLEDVVSHEITEKVTKKELEEAFKKNPDGFLYLKWQSWKGKNILRIDNNYEVAMLSEDGTEETSVKSNNTKKVVRATRAIDLSSSDNHSGSMPKAKVVGKLGSRSGYKKSQTRSNAIELAIKESGYSMNNVYEQRALRSSIDYSKMATLEDLFVQMAKDFGLTSELEVYKRTVENSKAEVKLSRRLSELNHSQLSNVQNFFAVYMMNMANKQINEAYNKYKFELMSIS